MPKSLNTRLKKHAALFVSGLLNDKKTAEFEKRMNQNRSLSQYVEELRETVEITSQLPVKQPSENFLKTQRNLLRGRIDTLDSESALDKITRNIEQFFFTIATPFRHPAIIVVTSLIIGIITGKLIFSPTKELSIPFIVTQTTEEKIQEFLKHGQLADSRIEYIKNGDGKIEFRLKTEDEYVYSGKPNDTLVKELLTYYLLHESNPGKRLKSIKLISESGVDEGLVMVYIAALLSDENPGVRLRAIEQLAQFPSNKIIRDASMKVLLEDKNTAIRMAALRILSKNPDERLTPVLQVVSNLDENEFIREQAMNILNQLVDIKGIEVRGE